jgi:hypothetical protein
VKYLSWALILFALLELPILLRSPWAERVAHAIAVCRNSCLD